MKKIFLLSLAILPVIASAYAFPDFRSFADELVSVLKILLTILTMIAFITFFWGLGKFILHSGGTKEIQEGKQFMIYGVLALFILVSLQGILIFMSSQLGFGNYIDAPLLPTESANSTINWWSVEDLEQ